MLSAADFLEYAPPFVQLARAGYLFAGANALTLDGVTPGMFVLFNSGSRSLPMHLLSVRVSSTAALNVQMLGLNADPALAVVNTPNNMRIGAQKSEALLEAALNAQPANLGVIADAQVGVSNDYELVAPGSMFLDNGRGVLISTANVAGKVSVICLWAEIENL